MIVKRWEKERIFDAKGIRNIIQSVNIFRDIDSIMSGLLTSSKFENAELLRSFQCIDRQKIVTLTNIITSSLEISGQGHVGIKTGIFKELDSLRNQYEGLDSIMIEKLALLGDDIR